MKDEVKENFKTIINNSRKAIIVGSDAGVGIYGDRVSVKATVCSLFENLGQAARFSKKDFEDLLNIVFNDNGKVKSSKELKKEALSALSDMLKELGD
jgi:hypothetical protein